MNLSNVSWSQVENWGLVKDLLGLLGVLNLIESVKRVIRKNLAWLTLEIYRENWSLGVWYFITFKGSSDPNHFIFEINVGKSRSMSDPLLSDIDFKKNYLGLDYP